MVGLSGFEPRTSRLDIERRLVKLFGIEALSEPKRPATHQWRQLNDLCGRLMREEQWTL